MIKLRAIYEEKHYIDVIFKLKKRIEDTTKQKIK
ncbi:MAG: hypothetical protein ACI9QN_000750 [Arcticibacterium sp.]|jgi:hypothetical protein